MKSVQPCILAPVPRVARHLTFALKPDSYPRDALQGLERVYEGNSTVVGLGDSLVKALGGSIRGLRTFPHYSGPGFTVPSTPAGLWVWVRGEDRGELVHRARRLTRDLAAAFYLDHVIDAFQYGPSLDLSGYEDGTENPRGEKAEEAAVVAGNGEGLDGSSFVAVQQWVHDLDHLDTLAEDEQDRIIGRRKRDNKEMEEAPPSAHVKRTAQERFNPPAFVLRRSMPWADGSRAGLVFVAFGKSFDAFDALLRRMAGVEDGISDALFRFTRPITGHYFWCPPVKDGALDLRALSSWSA